MAARNNVDAPDTAVNGRRPGREALAVKDVGRLLLHCADRPGLVAAVTTFLAQAGANIVSLDQHATEQAGGMFMQRTIFRPGLPTARDAMERDFARQVATRFNMHFALTEAAKPKRVAIMATKAHHCLPDLIPYVEWLRLVISAAEPRKDDLLCSNRSRTTPTGL
jgi:formyltetrahydrofolate hydrolase